MTVLFPFPVSLSCSSLGLSLPPFPCLCQSVCVVCLSVSLFLSLSLSVKFYYFFVSMCKLIYNPQFQYHFFVRSFSELCTKLQKAVRGLRLWAASILQGQGPELLRKMRLTEPLRTTPAVTNLLKKSQEMGGAFSACLPYTGHGAPVPTERPVPRVFYHSGRRHDINVAPVNCQQCGRRLGRLLLKDLQIGAKPEHIDPALDTRDLQADGKTEHIDLR